MPDLIDLENQNTRDIRYVDEKLQTLTTNFNKACNKQGQITSEVKGQVDMLRSQLNTDTIKLENRIVEVQECLNNKVDEIHKELVSNVTQLTASNAKIEATQTSIQKTLDKLVDVQSQLVSHDLRLQTLEGNTKTTNELRKEKIKANSTIIVAAISGILSLIGIIITSIFVA